MVHSHIPNARMKVLSASKCARDHLITVRNQKIQAMRRMICTTPTITTKPSPSLRPG